ncbi:DUF2470 domain-containing protein [Salinispora arenicola]|uniref:DUF2470 domain-containing protein n=1 Tax=Salinispora arenicola TaxID=168697 RepID=UPI0003775045|nr:DUF2470 domain-containing protein [Salinispora arenicola]MCN0180851.1 DUF2470 domain-containing protein [Salinispora arenicola]NIL42713.1 DUF2470 domain-containing protein [Salinispora arenicola]
MGGARLSNIHPDASAQRLRTIVAAATSLELRTPGHRADLINRHSLDPSGRIRIDLPVDSRLATDITHQREVAAVLEITDLAPTPVRDRVRGRCTLSGWLAPVTISDTRNDDEDLTVALDLAAVELSVDGITAMVDPADFAAAEPDLLAAEEAELLCHLDRRHPRTVERLCRLVEPRHRHGVQRVVPVRLDRHGLVLRLERVSGHRDVRLGFTSALRHSDELRERMAELLERGTACSRRTRTWLN